MRRMIFGNRKKKAEANRKIVDGLAIFAPAAGEMTPLTYIDDPGFAESYAGQGIIIRPTGDQVASPIIGTVEKVYDNGRAVMLTIAFGVTVLVYVGLKTDQLKKKHFTTFVSEGEIVGPGDVLIRFDRKGLEEAGSDAMIRLVVCDNEIYEQFELPEVKTIDELELIAALAYISFS